MILLVIIFGIFCYAAGVYHAENREECSDEILCYYCRRNDPRYSVGCDHTEVGVLEAKLAMAKYRAEQEKNDSNS